MATDLSVILEDNPGELARLGEATGQNGINVQGMAAFTSLQGLLNLGQGNALGIVVQSNMRTESPT